jgi:ribosomal protein S18 acetylase RimI-like enzyme
MRIRPYSSPDRDRIREILAASGTFTDDEVVVALEVIDESLGHPERDDYTVLCAQDDSGRVIGYVCFGPIPMTDRCFDLYWICVDRTVRGSGVGTSLIAAMEADLRERRARHIYIDTSSTGPYNDARVFYERRGYRTISRIADFYSEGDDKILYLKKP